MLVAEDRGGGLVILPGPQSSSFALQDFSSPGGPRPGPAATSGDSFATFLFTDREIDGSDGGGHNRVGGPSFLWRPEPPGLGLRPAPVFRHGDPEPPGPDGREWNGPDRSPRTPATSTGHALTRTYDLNFQYLDIGDDFRADVGFVPQVGVRDGSARSAGRFFPRRGLFRRIRPFLRTAPHRRYGRRPAPAARSFRASSSAASGTAHQPGGAPGDAAGGHGRLSIPATSCLSATLTPSGVVSGLALNLTVGEDADLVNARPGTEPRSAWRRPSAPPTTWPSRLIASRRTLDVSPTGTGRAGRAPVHGRGGPPQGDLHLHLPRLPAADRPAQPHRARHDLYTPAG